MGQDIDRGARVRAARAIARLTQPELGALLNTSGQTIKRMETGLKTPGLEELLKIADACGVPRWFMESGWDGRLGDAAEPTFAERMDRMERTLEALSAPSSPTATPAQPGAGPRRPQPPPGDERSPRAGRG